MLVHLVDATRRAGPDAAARLRGDEPRARALRPGAGRAPAAGGAEQDRPARRPQAGEAARAPVRAAGDRAARHQRGDRRGDG